MFPRSAITNPAIFAAATYTGLYSLRLLVAVNYQL